MSAMPIDRREVLQLFGLTALGVALGRPSSLLAAARPTGRATWGSFASRA
jgi:hypothetical protein